MSWSARKLDFRGLHIFLKSMTAHCKNCWYSPPEISTTQHNYTTWKKKVICIICYVFIFCVLLPNLCCLTLVTVVAAGCWHIRLTCRTSKVAVIVLIVHDHPLYLHVIAQCCCLHKGNHGEVTFRSYMYVAIYYTWRVVINIVFVCSLSQTLQYYVLSAFMKPTCMTNKVSTKCQMCVETILHIFLITGELKNGETRSWSFLCIIAWYHHNRYAPMHFFLTRMIKISNVRILMLWF